MGHSFKWNVSVQINFWTFNFTNPAILRTPPSGKYLVSQLCLYSPGLDYFSLSYFLKLEC